MDARTSRRQKRISKKQEDKTAADLGGKTQAASGALRLGGGGDVRAPGVRVECKYTEAPGYALKLSDLKKLHIQATKVLEEPVFQVQFRARGYVLSTWAIVRVHRYPEVGMIFQGLKQTTLLRSHLENAERGNQLVHVVFVDGEQVNAYEVIPWDVYLKRRKAANA